MAATGAAAALAWHGDGGAAAAPVVRAVHLDGAAGACAGLPGGVPRVHIPTRWRRVTGSASPASARQAVARPPKLAAPAAPCATQRAVLAACRRDSSPSKMFNVDKHTGQRRVLAGWGSALDKCANAVVGSTAKWHGWQRACQAGPQQRAMRQTDMTAKVWVAVAARASSSCEPTPWGRCCGAVQCQRPQQRGQKSPSSGATRRVLPTRRRMPSPLGGPA